MYICLNYIPHNEITYSGSSILEIQFPVNFYVDDLVYLGSVYGIVNGVNTNDDGSILYLEFSKLSVEELCIETEALNIGFNVPDSLQSVVSITDTNDTCEDMLYFFKTIHFIWNIILINLFYFIYSKNRII